MPIRPATKADIPTCAKILAAAFGPDPLFQVTFPHQKEHPEAFVQAMEEHLWLAWWDYSKVLMVSYYLESKSDATATTNEAGKDATTVTTVNTDNNNKQSDGQYEILTGIAEWQLIDTKSPHLHNITPYSPLLLLKPLLSKYHEYRRWLFPNPASAHPTPENPHPLTFHTFLPTMSPFITPFFSAPHRSTHLSLENLAIHPSHQRRGYGRALVTHGLVMAKDKGDIPVCVIAAPGKEGFYVKCGIGELVGWASEGLDSEGRGRENPLRVSGVGGGAVLWTK
jgi:GNAT superfamily N-acetyltransferase